MLSGCFLTGTFFLTFGFAGTFFLTFGFEGTFLSFCTGTILVLVLELDANTLHLVVRLTGVTGSTISDTKFSADSAAVGGTRVATVCFCSTSCIHFSLLGTLQKLLEITRNSLTLGASFYELADWRFRLTVDSFYESVRSSRNSDS